MKEIGLYIHIPYCVRKCGYCDFYSLTDLHTLEDYVLALEKSLDYYKSVYGPLRINSVFFGGGTPSVLKGEQMAGILNKVTKNFSVNKNAEITTEANPEHITKDFLRLVKKAGVNRISFGMQSGVKSELLTLDRSHENHHVLKAVELVNHLGLENYSLDIIQSIPGQTLKSLEKTLDFAVSLSPKHLSAYMLILEEGTPLYKKVKGGLLTLSDDEEAELYLYTSDFLKSKGFNHYEISNFSKEGYESSHNLNYWQGGDYLGIGPSAHSFFDKKRFYYENNLVDFIKNVPQPRLIFDDDGGDLEEYIMLNLRLSKGIDLVSLKNNYNLSKDDINRILLNSDSLIKKGLVELSGNNLHLSTQGFLLSNMVTLKILEGF